MAWRWGGDEETESDASSDQRTDRDEITEAQRDRPAAMVALAPPAGPLSLSGGDYRLGRLSI